MSIDVIRITDASSRAEIVKAITALRIKQDRMPRAWVNERAEVGEEIDALVDRWLLASN